MLWDSGKDKKVKEAWSSITIGSAEVSNKHADRRVFTKVFLVHTSHSNEAANGCPGGWCSLDLAVRKKSLLKGKKEHFFCKEWTDKRNFAALDEPQLLPSLLFSSAQLCALLPPLLSPVLQPPGAAGLPSGSSPALEMVCCLLWLGQFYYQTHYQGGCSFPENHNRKPHVLRAGAYKDAQQTTLISAPSHHLYFSLLCVLLSPAPAQPCCTGSCPLLPRSCLNPAKRLSKCPENSKVSSLNYICWKIPGFRFQQLSEITVCFTVMFCFSFPASNL